MSRNESTETLYQTIRPQQTSKEARSSWPYERCTPASSLRADLFDYQTRLTWQQHQNPGIFNIFNAIVECNIQKTPTVDGGYDKIKQSNI